ncbi:DR1-associated protein 1 (negative cofactor 2 alpha), partial [Dermatophagoides pteronyssinus]
MPSKKKRFNARFPPARIKKIMQKDEEVGKVAQAVPVIIAKALESFAEQLLTISSDVTRNRNARTLTPNHIKTAILNKNEFHFLRELTQSIPDVNNLTDEEPNASISTPSVTASSSSSANPVLAQQQHSSSVMITAAAATTTPTNSLSLSSITSELPQIINNNGCKIYQATPIPTKTTLEMVLPQPPTILDYSNNNNNHNNNNNNNDNNNRTRGRGRPRKRPLDQ